MMANDPSPIPREAPEVSFFTPGRRLAFKDSYIIVDQCYVQYRPALTPNSTKTLPILFVHGGGLTGAQWESTPDLRPGWACLANQLGHATYLLDTIDNGRSARAPNHIRPDANIEHRTAKEVWVNFRFGPIDGFETRQTFEHGQFPIKHFDSLLGSQVSRRRTNDHTEARGIADVVSIIGDCQIIAHSHGAALIMDALCDPELRDIVLRNTKRMVLVEPGPTSSARHLHAAIPTLVIWGDNLRVDGRWKRIAQPFEEAATEIIHLPDIGLQGNSHFPMSDTNSDEVFKVIMDWLKS